jgi:hypothetical protein
LQAVALKKNRCGTSPISKISDNEDATAALWYSGVLSVKNPVGEPIPEFPQASEEGSKIPPAPTGQDAGHVLPNQPLGPISVSNGKIGEHEVATRVIQPFSESCDAEGLTGSSSDENIDSCIRPLLKFGHVSQVRDIGVMMGED